MTQIERLRDDILSTNEFEIDPVIQVYTIEASVGKTRTMISALQDPKMQVKTLLVTKLISEQERIQKELRNAGVNVVIYNSENTVMSMDTMIEAQVLIITHEKYKKLCSDTSQAEIFTKGRQLLIIDEYIDILSYYSIEVNSFHDATAILERLPNEQAWKLYVEVVTPLKEMIDKRFSKDLSIQWIDEPLNKSDNEKLVDSIVNIVAKSHIPEKEFRDTGFKGKEQLIQHINSLRYCFNTNKVLIDKKRIYSANLNVKHLQGFNKTILLDASASFVELYKSELFSVRRFERTVDHSNTELIHGIIGTTQYAKSYRPEYLVDIKQYIRDNLCSDDNAVIFGSKEESYTLKDWGQQYGADVVTFAGSRGKNDWGAYNKAFIIHTPSLKQSDYIFQYLYYFPEEAKKRIGDNHAISFRMGTGGHHTFVNNNRLHSLRITDIASNMYQAVKRVDRNAQSRLENVQLHLLCNLNEVVSMVEHQLRGLKRKVTLKLIERKPKASPKTDADADIIYSVFSNISNGKYKKSEIRAMCGIYDRKQWSRAEQAFVEKYGLKSLEDIGVFEQGQSYIIQKNVS